MQGGLRPHLFCLPILKRERHREAVLAAATSGSSKFFLGTDSAPHAQTDKVRTLSIQFVPGQDALRSDADIVSSGL